MSEEPKRGRGRPPGSKNKAGPKLRPKSVRVEARKREARTKAQPKRSSPPPVTEVQAEIVLPGEEFGKRPRQDELDLPEPPEGTQLTLAWPRPVGRPPGQTILQPTPAILDRIWQVGWDDGSMGVLSVALGVSPKTLTRFFENHPIAKQTYEDAKQAGEGDLRMHYRREARGGNTPVLIHAVKRLDDRLVAVAAAEGDEPKQLQRIVIELVDAKN